MIEKINEKVQEQKCTFLATSFSNSIPKQQLYVFIMIRGKTIIHVFILC